jgi:hypothetical protein
MGRVGRATKERRHYAHCQRVDTRARAHGTSQQKAEKRMKHIVIKSGPAFGPPASLVDLLERSVAYAGEARRQAKSPSAQFVDSDSLPTEYALIVTHNELDRVVSRG